MEVKRKSDQLIALQERVDVQKRTLDETEISEGEEKLSDCKDSALETKLAEQERLQRYLSDMQHESLILQRTVDILRSRHHDIESFMSEEEERANAKGFHKVQATLKNTVDNVAEVDVMKGQTLQEISGMVTKITDKLKIERERLQPMVRLWYFNFFFILYDNIWHLILTFFYRLRN